MLRVALTTALCCLALACKSSTPVSGCEGNSACEAGEVCDEGECRTLCSSDLECVSGEVCRTDICVPGDAAGEPEITELDGNGSVDGRTGHSQHRFRDAIYIRGENLLGAEPTLIMSSGARPLDVDTTSTRDEMLVYLPDDLQAGSHTIRVENQLGEAQADATILAGERSLINMAPEPIGANCGAGGLAIQAGVDLDGSGSLDAGEVDATNYVCNGSDTNLDGGELASRINSSSAQINADRVESQLPAGTIIMWTQDDNCPTGFELMDGVDASGGTEADMRGRLPRGADVGAVDATIPDGAGAPFGSDVLTAAQLPDHTHTLRTAGDGERDDTVRKGNNPYAYTSDAACAECDNQPHYHASVTVLFCRKL